MCLPDKSNCRAIGGYDYFCVYNDQHSDHLIEPGGYMATYQSIKKQIAALEAQAEQLRKAEAARIVASIKAQIAKYDLKPSDLFDDAATISVESDVPAVKTSARKSAPKGKSLKAKYMDPVSKKTWSGHGKAPEWIKKGNREDFLIGAVSKGKPAAKPVAAKAVPKSTTAKKKVMPAKAGKDKVPAASTRVVAKKAAAAPAPKKAVPNKKAVTVPAAKKTAVKKAAAAKPKSRLTTGKAVSPAPAKVKPLVATPTTEEPSVVPVTTDSGAAN